MRYIVASDKRSPVPAKCFYLPDRLIGRRISTQRDHAITHRYDRVVRARISRYTDSHSCSPICRTRTWTWIDKPSTYRPRGQLSPPLELLSSKQSCNYLWKGPKPELEAIYLCSKSTGAVTSCTRKYLASAGYFRATASRHLARHLVYFRVAIAFSRARR